MEITIFFVILAIFACCYFYDLLWFAGALPTSFKQWFYCKTKGCWHVLVRFCGKVLVSRLRPEALVRCAAGFGGVGVAEVEEIQNIQTITWIVYLDWLCLLMFGLVGLRTLGLWVVSPSLYVFFLVGWLTSIDAFFICMYLPWGEAFVSSRGNSRLETLAG